MKPSQKARCTRKVQAALAWAQRKLYTAFHLTVRPFTKEELAESGASVMAINLTARDTADPTHFIIGFNADVIAATSTRATRVLAAHELIHAILWPLSQLAEAGKKGSEMKRAVDVSEDITYRLQRIIVGEM